MIAEVTSNPSKVQNNALVSTICLELICSSRFIKDSNLRDRVQYLIEKMLWTLKKLNINTENIH